MPAGPTYDCYAVTPPGVERLTADELTALGLTPSDAEMGGVAFGATARELRSANLHLRTANRILVRLGEFHASAFYQLEQRARKLPWEAFVAPGDTVLFRVTSRKSKLYHQKGIAERLGGAVVERVPGARIGLAPGKDDEGDGDTDPGEVIPGQLFVVRVVHDRCLVSADSSGALLHRRGYRRDTAKAPLRETLAASLLLAAGWDGTRPLLDPMCGSGTIPIEAALIARRVPPGLRRRFRFEGWPDHDTHAWRAELDGAHGQIRARSPVAIAGSDRDAGAVEASAANADRAGVAEDVTFRRAALSALELPAGGPGWIITNPPYGLRVGEAGPLRDLYARLGAVVREGGVAAGWGLALIAADPGLVRQAGLPFQELVSTANGGIRVRMLGAPG